MNIQMVDVKSQFDKISDEVMAGIREVIDTTSFINGPAVKTFASRLEEYLGVKKVVPCANGTDALQIALMALGLKHGDEVIVPAFTYVATAEVIALLGLKPKMVDVDPHTFNLTAEILEEAITPMTKAVVPVHLYGQCSDMEAIMDVAKQHHLYVIEDTAQAIGADYTFYDGTKVKSGAIGHIGTTSFYPSKNLGAYGDGGAIYTNDEELGKQLYMIANHGQSVKYVHDVIGCNSRLDSIQAAVLNVKLKYLDNYAKARQDVAAKYDEAFKNIDGITPPFRSVKSTHVFHQYTLKVAGGKRDHLKEYLDKNGIPTMIYYPIPLYRQKAFAPFADGVVALPVTEQLCKEVISLPIHTEMKGEELEYIIDKITKYYH